MKIADMKLIFATHNPGKLQEVKELLAPKYEVIGLTELNDHEDIPENESTLEGNALVKARAIWGKYQLSCFSDDTGLEIDALHGAPGVLSARYGGIEKDPDLNMDKVLAELSDVELRTAQFRTSIALIINGQEQLFHGVVKGTIRRSRSGGDGFGYDPIFEPDGYQITFAEMSNSEKNKISHRGMAIDALVKFLKE
jgi:XTP/dITP diphosphohydrolase